MGGELDEREARVYMLYSTHGWGRRAGGSDKLYSQCRVPAGSTHPRTSHRTGGRGILGQTFASFQKTDPICV